MKSTHPLAYVALAAVFLFGFLSARNVPDIVNSQTLMSIFGPAVSLPKVDVSSKTAFAPETPDLVFVGQTGLRASTPPETVTPKVLGAIMGGTDSDARPDIFRYQIEQGDTIVSLAQKFNISAQTIMWANDLTINSRLEPGKELMILPVSGVLHVVRPGDTLSEIASWYKVKGDDVVQFNNLSFPGSLFAGDILVIPNGVMPKTLPHGRLTLLPNSYFIWPIPSPHRITQGLHPFNAVDMSNGSCGDPVYAAAGGEIQKTGYTILGGNYARVLHPNGVVTYYGHLAAILAGAGQKVFQGQTIGYVGHTGVTIPSGSSGCHVHFEVRGATNPFLRFYSAQ